MDSASHFSRVYWVSLVSPLIRGFFPGFSVFPPCAKPNALHFSSTCELALPYPNQSRGCFRGCSIKLKLLYLPNCLEVLLRHHQQLTTSTCYYGCIPDIIHIKSIINIINTSSHHMGCPTTYIFYYFIMTLSAY